MEAVTARFAKSNRSRDWEQWSVNMSETSRMKVWMAQVQITARNHHKVVLHSPNFSLTLGKDKFSILTIGRVNRGFGN